MNKEFHRCSCSAVPLDSRINKTQDRKCENCRKFLHCWFPYPEPFGHYTVEKAQECIKLGYKYWELETIQQANKKAEREICIFILLCFVLLLGGVLYFAIVL